MTMGAIRKVPPPPPPPQSSKRVIDNMADLVATILVSGG